MSKEQGVRPRPCTRALGRSGGRLKASGMHRACGQAMVMMCHHGHDVGYAVWHGKHKRMRIPRSERAKISLSSFLTSSLISIHCFSSPSLSLLTCESRVAISELTPVAIPSFYITLKY
jgi:hypothetical protein